MSPSIGGFPLSDIFHAKRLSTFSLIVPISLIAQ